MLTLTVRHGPADRLKPLIRRLLDAWAELRRGKLWRERVRGGASVLEVKHSPGKGGFHPHLHVLMDADYIDHRWLKAAWDRLAGCKGVRVEAVRSAGGAARYVAGYVTKQIDGSCYASVGVLTEVMEALKGTRMVGTFGSWRGVELTEGEEAFDPAEWKPLARLDDVLQLAAEGVPHALRILARLRGEAGPPGEGSTAEESDRC